MKVKSGDIFSIETAKGRAYFQYFGKCIFVISVLVEIFYATIVTITIKTNLKFFRILTYFYIGFCILAEIIFLCWKPVKLSPLMIVYPVGVMAPMSSRTSAVLMSTFATSMAILVDILANVEP